MSLRLRSVLLGAVSLAACAVLFSVPSPTSALTTVPTKMNFQGRLTDSTGNIKPNGTYNMRLKLYTVSTAGSPVWSEDRLVSATQGVTVTNGLFSIQLGSVTTLPASLFASGQLYLEVELPSPATATSSTPTWSEGPMTPRNQMATSAYAYNAETLDGLDSAAFGQLGQSNTWTGVNSFNANSFFDGTTLAVDATNDRVGIGNTAPQVRLEVGANTNVDEFIVVRSQGRAGMYLYADTDNDPSDIGAPFVEFFQDGTGTNAILGLSQVAGTTATGAAYTNLDVNSLLLGTYTNSPLVLGTFGVVRVAVSAAGDVVMGAPDTTGNVLVLDTKTDAGDPTGAGATNGAMYYNANLSKFRCFEAGAWKDCDTSGGGSISSGTTASRPASPSEGTLYFDTTTKQLLTYANGKWQADRSNSTKIVAASNSPQAAKDAADYVANGESGNGQTTFDGDQVEINAALTAAAGGKVYLLEGTYVADGTILIPNNTTLAGAGDGTVIELANIGTAVDNLIENSDTTTGAGVSVHDLKIDGRRDINGAVNQYGIYMNGIGGGSGSTARSGATIENVTALRWRRAVYLNATAYTKVAQVNMYDNGLQGFYMAGSSHNTVTNSASEGNASSGFWIDTSTNNTFTNLVSKSNLTSGFILSGSSGNTVTGSVIASNSTYGIHLQTTSLNNIVSGNDVTSNGSTGLSLNSGSDNNTFSSNTAQGNNRGINVQTSYNTISGNTATQNVDAGIRIATSLGNTVSGNTLRDNGGATTNDGIVLDDADNTSVTGNSISDTSATTENNAIDFYTGLSDNVYLADNLLGGGTIFGANASTIYGGQIDTSGRLISSSAGGQVSRLQSGSTADLYQGQNSSGTALFKVTSTGAIQGTSLDTVGATALALGGSNATAININQNATVLAGKTLTIGTVSNGIILSDTGYTLAGTARNSKRITLAAEYANAVLDAGTGSSNTGSMTAALDLTNRMNYYKWTTTQGTNQSYDVVVQVPIPSDFSAWASSTPITVSTRTSDLTNGLITIEARDTAGTVVSGMNFSSITPTATGAWQGRSAGTISGTYTAGGYMTLRIRLQSPNAGDVRLGNITLDYLSKW